MVIFETQRIFGGDSMYYYLGTYQIENEQITGAVNVNHYADERRNVFGDIESLKLDFKGKISSCKFEAVGGDPLDSQRNLRMIFTKLAGLP